MKNIHVHSLPDANGKFHAEQGFPTDANALCQNHGGNGRSRMPRKRLKGDAEVWSWINSV